jgi:hypothetical protein
MIDVKSETGLEFCEICDAYTPTVEVIQINTMLDESWSEPECKYCFEDSLDWEERYG